MLIKLIEVARRSAMTGGTPDYKMNEVFVNPENIVSIREDVQFNVLFKEGQLPWGDLNPHTTFSTLTMNSGGISNTVTVAGSPSQIQEKCFDANKQLLKG
tara:strand:+ start:676 stop:975 length:300 start_codon:yes stop_codon:yes gene_type:complete